MTLLTPSTPRIQTVTAHSLLPCHPPTIQDRCTLRSHPSSPWECCHWRPATATLLPLAWVSTDKEIRTQRCCQGWSCVRRIRRNVGNYELNTHFARIAKALPKPSFVWCTTRRDRLVHQFSWYPFCSSFSISCIHSTASRAISPIRIDKARKESPLRHGLCDLLVFWHGPPQHHNYQPEGQTLC